MNDYVRRSSRTRLSKIQESNRRRAREKARRIRADTLAELIDRYVEWRGFVLWARAIVESEGKVPPLVARALELRCPDFQPEVGADREPEFWLRLCRWIDHSRFREAKEEGWLIAVEYYASRDLRWQQLWLCWEYYDEQWQKSRPASYPTFEEWCHRVQAWRFPPPGGKRAIWDNADRVSPEELKKAVSEYLDWEAFAYWVRAVVRAYRGMPRTVAELLGDKCPGFLDQLTGEGARLGDATTVWRRLIAWVDDRVFGSAKAEGWFEAVTLFARSSLHAERTVAYWAACDREWSRRRPSDCPGFDEWRRAAETYTEA
ncbi:MAG: hypothetical protein M1335_08350 [Chloroflexi bacterium]|nr:hypothetical protein [Chloroflexota bacterium]